MRLTIITCFHDSRSRLPTYVQALRALAVGGVTLDVVWVDNASRDGTEAQLRVEAAHLPWPVCVLQEPTPGLMHARCAGVAEAQGDWLLFLDDDNEPRPDYLQELLRLIAKYPEASFYSGNSLPPAEYAMPAEWVQAAAYIALRQQTGEIEFELTGLSHPCGPWGAGLFGRRTSLGPACRAWKAGDCRIAGRTGSGLSGGEDHWMIHHVCRTQPRCVFSDRLVLVHRLDRRRTDPRHLARVAYQLGADTPDHFDAFRAVRPELPVAYPTGWRVLKFWLGQVPRTAFDYWRHGGAARMLWFCQVLGLAQALAVRRWEKGGQAAQGARAGVGA